MTDVFTVLEELAKRCDGTAQARAGVNDPKGSSAWLDRSAKLRAASEMIRTQELIIETQQAAVDLARRKVEEAAAELQRLGRIEETARAVDSLYDERMKVVLMCTRYRDGVVDRSCHFDAMRVALRGVKATEEAKGEQG